MIFTTLFLIPTIRELSLWLLLLVVGALFTDESANQPIVIGMAVAAGAWTIFTVGSWSHTSMRFAVVLVPWTITQPSRGRSGS